MNQDYTVTLFKWSHHMICSFILTNVLTIDVIWEGGTAGQVQDWAVAAVDVPDDVATQRCVHVEGKKYSNTQQSDEPGQGAAEVQSSWCHDGVIPERFTHSNVPAKGEQHLKTF